MRGERAAPITTPGELWSARARDWAMLQETQHRPKYRHAIDHIDIGPGTAVLDLGCGAGTLCRVAADVGASVTGIDAAPGLVELASDLVPEGRFEVGDMRRLPYADASFDRITAFNSLQFLPEPATALAEARRVARPGALVYVLVWGRPVHTGLMAVMNALHPLMPARPSGSGGPFALTPPGTLEHLLAEGGFEVLEAAYISIPYEYPDEETMLRAQGSSAPAVLASRTVGEATVQQALRVALAPFAAGDWFRIDTEYRFVTARSAG